MSEYRDEFYKKHLAINWPTLDDDGKVEAGDAYRGWGGAQKRFI
jgi:hypothetical protein